MKRTKRFLGPVCVTLRKVFKGMAQLLTLAMLVVVANSAQAFTQDANGVYQIGTADELYEFASLVNSGTTNANAILTNDIVVNSNVLNADGTINATDSASFRDWTPIGNNSTIYIGTFNGNGHTVSGLYFNNSGSSYVGLFGYIGKDCEVGSFGVLDSYIRGNDYVSDVCGYNEGGTISNSYNMGCVSGSDYVGGVCGDNDGGTISNCYYLASESNGSDAKTADQFASGEVAYLLSHGDSDGSVWGQKLGTDTIPVFSSNKVYSYTNCQNNIVYTNDETLDGLETIHIYNNGFCVNEKTDGTKCDAYQPATINDGVYEIAKAGELYWFANLVNSGTTGANAILTDNIIVNDTASWTSWNESTTGLRCWTPIGNETTSYSGSFNGKGYTISGLYCSLSSDNVGLFGAIGKATVANVGLEKSYIHGDNTVGSICGHCEGTVNGDNLEGGIFNCYNSGTVDGLSNVGGICGYSSNANLANCFSTGSVTGSSSIGAICGEYGNTNAVSTNCYYLNGTDVSETATTKSADQFASGEVAILLQKFVDESGDATLADWMQVIGDASPTFGKGGIQYMREKKSNNWGTLCVPYAISETNAAFYTVDKMDGDVLVLKALESEESEECEGKVDAGVPVIYYCAEDTLMVLVQVFGNPANTKNDGMLKGVYEQTTVAGENTYYLKNNMFYRCNDNFTVGAFKAYLQYQNPAGAPRALNFMLNNETATGVDAVANGGATGDVRIEAIYNIKGQCVAGMQKGGIYILKMSDGSTQKVIIR